MGIHHHALPGASLCTCPILVVRLPGHALQLLLRNLGASESKGAGKPTRHVLLAGAARAGTDLLRSCRAENVFSGSLGVATGLLQRSRNHLPVAVRQARAAHGTCQIRLEARRQDGRRARRRRRRRHNVSGLCRLRSRARAGNESQKRGDPDCCCQSQGRSYGDRRPPTAGLCQHGLLLLRTSLALRVSLATHDANGPDEKHAQEATTTL
mmetsp:Transcript_84308/g.243710  ORF Transcript_84308/g.243710 Transcript_84308/m.243710 type:complete len:210 (-) Transcript_84308:30-659(-)